MIIIPLYNLAISISIAIAVALAIIFGSRIYISTLEQLNVGIYNLVQIIDQQVNNINKGIDDAEEKLKNIDESLDSFGKINIVPDCDL